MDKYIIATIKSWNIENYKHLEKKYPDSEFRLISNKDDLSEDFLEQYDPKYIFFPHWSWIIPKSIFERYNCVVFHMTDLPFGRGGSPLQNLIVRGIYDTKISAIKVSSGVDTGPVYFKEPFNIAEGNANDILSRASDIIFEKMIPRFLTEDLKPTEQTGDVVTFKRRTPEESEIPEGLTQREIYDYIRMLDGEGYPMAYKRIGDRKVFFSDARFEDGVVMARVRFAEDEE